jgi:curved DNA-binding protein
VEYKDYYAIMGVGREATADELKRVYRRLARKYHPDVSKEPDAEARFKEIGEAYEALRDPEKRAAYDALGQRKPGEEFRPPPDWGFDFAQAAGAAGHGAHAGDYSDFFESLFGGLGGGGAARGRGFRARGFDTTAQIDVTLEEAYGGASRNVSMQRLEPDAQGRPQPKARELTIRIPAGVTDGQRVRVPAQGEPGIGGGTPGDLILEVRHAPHRWFRAEGRDIWLELPVTPWEAALGETVRVPTLGGRVDVRVPKGSQAGRQLRLKGRGLPGNPPGDQFVVLKIVTPPADTPAAEALYQEMADSLPMNPRAEMEG